MSFRKILIAVDESAVSLMRNAVNFRQIKIEFASEIRSE
jgi:hypothetical protein